MNQIIDLIKQTIARCERNGDMFIMPSIDRDDVRIKEIELAPSGSSLYHCEYQIDFDDGNWIQIDYASKDRMRTFQINPDRSEIEVKCSDPLLNFSKWWDERVI